MSNTRLGPIKIMSIKQLVELQNEANLLSAAWLRQLLTLASGSLAILAGLSPHTHSNIDKYFLVATWVFLGLGIIFGAAATYLEVNRASRLVLEFRSQVELSLHAGQDGQLSSLIFAHPQKFYLASKYIMVYSLLLSVVSLVSYAVLSTLLA